MTKDIQYSVINALVQEKSIVTIYLVSGFQMKGIILDFDSFTIIFESDGKKQLIYKHAISTIVPLPDIL